MTQAQQAKVAAEKASILENIDTELAAYNIDTITGDPKETTAMLNNLISKGVIDTVLTSDNSYKTSADSVRGIPNFDDAGKYTGYIDYSVIKDGYQIILSIDDQGIYKAEYGEVNISAGGSVAGGTTLVTENAFKDSESSTNPEDKGKFTITENNASVMFVDEVGTKEVDGKKPELSILVPDGKTANIYVFEKMVLTNEKVDRSAIDLGEGATLNLWIKEGAEVTVNSGFGKTAVGDIAGAGGYAGIHVPVGATLNLKGDGTIIAIGGNAGGSESSTTSTAYNAGGGGAGAGIGGNGGNGAKGGDGIANDSSRVCPSAGSGESCGSVNIYNSLTVYAYGGGGGYGGKGLITMDNGDINDQSGGGGGYPGAGIGGGGAGGAGATCCTGAGGYSGGASSSNPARTDNGLSGGVCDRCTYRYWGGGGYFQGQEGYDLNDIELRKSCFGGMGGTSYYRGHRAGDGGQAGNGGTINVSSTANVYAFNGNMYTDGASGHEYNNGLNQCPIYLQNGISIARYNVASWGNRDTIGTGDKYYLSNRITLTSTATYSNTVTKSGYTNNMYTTNSTFSANKTLNINTKLGMDSNTNSLLTNVDMSKQGVGSGAGYVEVSNGLYKINTSLN